MTRIRRFVLALMLPAILCQGPGTARGAIAPAVSPLASISEGISTPVRLAADQFGNIYVADPRGGGILKFNSAGKPLGTIAATGDVLGIAIAQNGDLLVSQGAFVSVFDTASGLKRSQFGSFLKANGIAVDAGGFIYVADSLNNCVQVFNPAYAPAGVAAAASGMPANSFGSRGIAPGQFLQPSGISFERVSGQLAVADTLNGRVQFFTTSGVYQSSLGSFGFGPLRFSSPQGVAFEYSRDGRTLSRIYVVDSYQSNIQVIDAASAAFLRNIGSYGTASGKLVLPSDLLYDQFDPARNRLIVANGTGSIALFSIDQGAATPATSGPQLSINSVPLATNLSSLTVSGTTASGAGVTVNGVAVPVSAGAWSRSITLAAGINLITVTASDASGTTVQTLSVDLVASGSTLPLVALSLSSAPALSAVTPITLSGTVTSGASVLVNGAAANVSGSAWSLPVNLSSGGNTFQIVASKAGFADSTQSFNIALDSSVPVLTALLLPDKAVTSAPVQTISGTVSDSGAASVLVDLNGVKRSVPVVNGLFSLSLPLAYGDNAVSITAVDAGGNLSAPVTRTLTYDPQAPAATVTTPSGAISAAQSFTLTGTAPLGCSVTVDGNPASVAAARPAANAQVSSGTSWSYSATLQPGVNYFEVKVTDPVSHKVASAGASVSFDPGKPEIAVTSPAQDMATARPSVTITGRVTPGASASATVNGQLLPINPGASGDFTLTLPDFSVPGNYPVVVSATDNSTGASSSVTRSVIYDPSVPVITVVSEAPNLKVAVTGGVLVGKDKTGPKGTVTVTGNTSTLDLTGVAYDPASLNIYALTAAGTSSRNGDLDGDGKLGLGDALKALQIADGLLTPTTLMGLRGDVGPFTGGAAAPDGVIDSRDALILLRAYLGLINLY
jgi:hypothetical protein